MTALLLVFLLLAPAQEGKCRTLFRRLCPERASEKPPNKAAKKRAVVLINGFKPHPFSRRRVDEPIASTWQSADSRLGRALRPHADLYAFTYGQNVAVRKTPDAKDRRGRSLGDHVAALREAGYEEIVFVGFSAGALVARQFVEDHPDSGVTRVVQVCPPNAGTNWGAVNAAVRENQEIFINSMTPEARRKQIEARAEKGVRIPEKVEFVVVMGTLLGRGDTLASRESQWPEDLRKQGVPVVPLATLHSLAMRTKKGVKLIAKLAATKQARWSKEKVAEMEKELFD